VEPRDAPWRVLEGSAVHQPGGVAESGPQERSRPMLGGLAIAAVAGLLVIGAFVLAFGSGTSGRVEVTGAVDAGATGAAEDPDAGPKASPSGVLVVEIVGAVEHPGVYRLARDARVGDLVSAAGGYGPRVDADRAGRVLNLAAPLHDGDQVRVPSRDDPGEAATASDPGPRPAGAAGGPLSLGRATQAELEALPGIGPATATKIIASREHNPFKAVDDLRTRKLVGEKTFVSIRDLVTVP
jgi:competence protein ComEA